MKILAFIVSFSAILLFACNNSSDNSGETDTADTSVVDKKTGENIDTVQIVNSDKTEINTEELNKILKGNEKLYENFKKYISLLNSKITSEDKIKQVFENRKKLRAELTAETDKFYFSEGETNQELRNKVEKELLSIGYRPVYAEGMFVDLAKAPVLKEEINKYCSEPFKLKIEFDNRYAEALGGEYPFAALQEYFDAFETGYNLYDKYPETEYYKDIETDFNEIVLEFADIHKIKDECFEGGLHSTFYPWSTLCNISELFIKRFPNTVFSPVFTELQKNMSEFDNPKNTIYLVVTNTFEGNDAYDFAGYKIFEFMSKGIDIVHNVKVKNKEGKDVYYVTYRFYSDKNKAENALSKIKEVINDAKIIPVKIDDNENVIEI